MNPSTALAIAVRDELASAGVRRVVISPGSRSTPLALALAHAADAGWFELFIRIDERSAGFLALGLAKHSGEPTAVLCTSGSAVANLAPAVVEASYAGVPLVVLTADRPPSLRSTGANQTIDQVGFYGQLVRRSLDLSTGEQVGKHVTANSDRWRPDLQRALHASLGAEGAIGPVQINLGFVEPLIPDDPADLAVGMKPEVAVEAVRPGIAEPINHAFADLGYTTIPNK